MSIYKRSKNGKFTHQRSGVFTSRIPSIVNVIDENGEVLPTDTEQHHVNDTDINQIVGKFIKTGLIPQVQSEKTFRDVSGGLSYQDTLDILNDANARFSALSAKIRRRFNDNPHEFLEFVDDKDNYDEAVKLGIFLPAQKASAGSNTGTLGAGGDGAAGEAPAKAGGGE